jgi:tRNA (guanine37-N1)-methyltransferase
MLALKVEKRLAQKAREVLVLEKAMASGFKAKRTGKFVFFPASKKIPLKFKHEFVETYLESVEKIKPLKELLAEILSAGELNELVSSYDVVGTIGLLDVPKGLLKKKKLVARLLLQSNKRIKTVVRKIGKRKGVFRLKKYEWLTGVKTFETIHRESGCLFKVNLAKDYFSSRLVSERERIAAKAKNGEKILALFAGVGPFPIVIAKRKRVSIKAVELNPHAAKLMKENVVLNKLEGQIQAFQGDAVAYAKKFGGWADRILMTLPYGSEKFLDSVVKNARRGCIIHYYNLGGKQEGVFSNALKQITFVCRKRKRKFKVLEKRIVLPYAPRVFHIVVDFKLLN